MRYGSLGYALIGDLGRFDIARIYLNDGMIWLDAVSPDPCPVTYFAGGSCMVRIYSSDGKVVGIVEAMQLPGWNLGPRPGTVTVELTLRMESSRPGEPYMQVQAGT